MAVANKTKCVKVTETMTCLILQIMRTLATLGTNNFLSVITIYTEGCDNAFKLMKIRGRGLFYIMQNIWVMRGSIALLDKSACNLTLQIKPMQ